MLAAAIVAALLPLSVTAASVCGPRADLVGMLTDQFGEQVIGAGITADGKAMMEVYVHPNTGAWTTLMSAPGPEPQACVLETGEGWRTLAPLPGEES